LLQAGILSGTDSREFSVRVTQGLLEYILSNQKEGLSNNERNLLDFLPTEVKDVIPYLKKRYNGNLRILPKVKH
jgi:hypothetical protein